MNKILKDEINRRGNILLYAGGFYFGIGLVDIKYGIDPKLSLILLGLGIGTIIYGIDSLFLKMKWRKIKDG